MDTLEGVITIARLEINDGLGGDVIAESVLSRNNKTGGKNTISVGPRPSTTGRNVNGKIASGTIESITITG